MTKGTNKKIKILYVDDDPLNLKLFQLFVNLDNVEVMVAKSGSEALSLLSKKTDIKAMFSDYQMPGMNGIELITTTKERHSHIKCYLLTCFNLDSIIQKALASKLINGYLQKPLSKNKILDVVCNLSHNGNVV